MAPYWKLFHHHHRKCATIQRWTKIYQLIYWIKFKAGDRVLRKVDGGKGKEKQNCLNKQVYTAISLPQGHHPSPKSLLRHPFKKQSV